MTSATVTTIDGAAPRAIQRRRSWRITVLLAESTRSSIATTCREGGERRRRLPCNSGSRANKHLPVSQIEDRRVGDRLAPEVRTSSVQLGSAHKCDIENDIENLVASGTTNTDHRSPGTDRDLANILDVDNTIAEGEALATETVLRIARF